MAGAPQTGNGDTVQSRYYSSSLRAPAEKILEAVRQHWSLEDSLHSTLHVSFCEEQRRVRKDHAPQDLDTLRQISHNPLKKASSPKTGIQGKRPNAGWGGDYLLKVLPG